MTRAGLLALLLALLASGSAHAEPIWRLAQPDPPSGARFRVPLGRPGDLAAYGRNRVLLAVEGNRSVPRGIFSWNGRRWRQLSTVCGGPGDTARIAFAGPREFWTITQPSPPRFGNGTALCHFRDGEVVGSYSTPGESFDPFHQMAAAACDGPNNCWFGGFGAADPSKQRVGAFHLHWDGTGLRTYYAPQGRGTTGIAVHGGTFWESTLVGPRPESPSEPDLQEPEKEPLLLRRIAGSAFVADGWTPSLFAGVPADGSELLAIDSDGDEMWAVGGGAASGPSAPESGSVTRPPLAVRNAGAGWSEVPLDADLFGTNDRLVDVASVPGTAGAWAAVQPFSERASVNTKAKVARIAPNGATTVMTLPASGAGRGSAAKVLFTAPNDGWLVTYAGWIFHYTDGEQVEEDTDPAFLRTITFRPNEAAAQYVADAPPEDDSRLFAPPPLEIAQDVPPATTETLPPVMTGVRSRLRKRTILEIRFRLVRRARIGLSARRRGRVVARTRTRTYRPGRVILRLRLNPKRWPTRLRLSVTEPGAAPPDNGDTVTTGGDTVTTG